MSWLRVGLLATAAVSLIATMVAEAAGAKVLVGFFSGAVVGVIWTLLLRQTIEHESDKWRQITENASEAQRLIDQVRGRGSAIYGITPMDPKSFRPFEVLGEIPFVALFFVIGYVLTLNPSVYGYVLDLQHPLPPQPKTFLLYIGMLFSFSAGFLGLSSKFLDRLFPREHTAASGSAP